MHFTEETRNTIWQLAQARAHERLVVANGLADEIANRVVRKLQTSREELAGDGLAVRVLRMVDFEVAAHFRRQNAMLRNGSASTLDGADVLRWFVGGTQHSVDGDGQHIWAHLHATLDDRQRELVTLMMAGTPQHEIAMRLGYANSAVVKVTVNRLRTKLRNSYAAHLRGADAPST